MTTLLSIVIPVYNCEKYLPICLDSILSMQRTDLEIWLINDGSTDDSEQVCQNYAQRYAFVHTLTQKNAGPSAARNTGLAHASGEYIAFLDGDDWIDPEAFQQTLRWLREVDGNIWVSDFYFASETKSSFKMVHQISARDPIMEKCYIDTFLAQRGGFWSVWRYIFKKSFLEQSQLRFLEGIHFAEDLEFIVQALIATDKIIFYHNPYYFYRIVEGEASLTHQYSLIRMQSVLSMLQISVDRLSHSQVAYRQIMIDKLVREYILQLLWYYDIPRSERKQINLLFWDTRKILDQTSRFLDRVIGVFLKIFKVPFTAFVLYLLKSLWHLLKKVVSHT